ncbi:MAG TPA: bile acid:sodium symporter family protein [Steroidobacteraceae bacterium]|nr:bile acid:sodium symporter family protein [Steroidobacteraceae bacterium]
MNELDAVRLNFSPESLVALDVILAFVLFGVALDMRVQDFKGILTAPRGTLIGLLAHSVLLPAVAWALTMLLKPSPSIALGMILVASCPSGNISTFLVNYARGNTALSVTIAAFSMLGSILFTPFNLSFWGQLNPSTRPILHAVTLSAWEVFGTIVVLLGIPTVLGMWVAHRWPRFAARARGAFRTLSLLFFVLFVVGALVANWDFFLKYVGRVVLFVFLLNAFALITGYFTARGFRLVEGDRRAVAFEVGIQNSGFGLVLVFNFFGGLGGMAIVAAWWGIWHILVGTTLASIWRRFPPPPAHAPAEVPA